MCERKKLQLATTQRDSRKENNNNTSEQYNHTPSTSRRLSYRSIVLHELYLVLC